MILQIIGFATLIWPVSSFQLNLICFSPVHFKLVNFNSFIWAKNVTFANWQYQQENA